MSSGLSSIKDVSMQSRAPGPGVPVHLNWMCGCRKPSSGGQWRNGIPWRCMDCKSKIGT